MAINSDADDAALDGNREPASELLMKKAMMASSSAYALINKGDAGGAVNRAWFATFHALCAVLLARDVSINLDALRSRDGLVGAVRVYFVGSDLLWDVESILVRTYDLREAADYGESPVELAEAIEIINKTSIFVVIMRHELLAGQKL